jgi:N-acetylmuramoyl-L-alanine amidase
VDGAIAIRVVSPEAGSVRPAVDSTFIFGSLGTGRATLTVNGTPVEVAPNGAFLGYVAVPTNGVYELRARAGADTARLLLAYRTPPNAAPAPTPPAAAAPAAAAQAAPAAPAPVSYPVPQLARVVRARDTVSTGSGVAFGRRGLTGTFIWYLPRGAEVAVVGERAGQYELKLGTEPVAFMPDSFLVLGGAAPPVAPRLAQPSLRPASEWVDVVVPAAHAAFLVEQEGRTVELTIYGRRAAAGSPRLQADPLIAGADWAAVGSDAVRLDLLLSSEPWGYAAFYDEAGNLVLRLRRAPRIDPSHPLRGRRIVVDPGHPPAGAAGPTGLTEAEANLAVATSLAEQLRAAGAEVVMTHTTNAPPSGSSVQAVDLAYRTDLAVRSGAELFVSLHNNAFPEGVNPFIRYGTEAYYFHAQSRALAEALNAEISRATGIPNLGVKSSDFAVVRMSWMPAVLTESLFMMFPQQEAALRNPEFIDRLAAAHRRGIENFLRVRSAEATR